MSSPSTPLNVRFWRKVRKTESCWIWIAYRNQNGYGTMKYKNRAYLAHRVAYTLTHGEIPEGKLVCHKCDVPQCVNPEHLFLANQRANMRDCLAKGRFVAWGDKLKGKEVTTNV